MENATTVEIGGTPYEVQPITGRRAIRATKIVRALTRVWPDVIGAMAKFEREYEQENAVELDRATARHEFRPRVLYETEPVMVDGEVQRTPEGEIALRQKPVLENGKPVLGPDPLGHLTEQDWAASDNKLRLPKSPSDWEKWASVFELAMDAAEDQIIQLLALGVIDGDLLKEAAHSGGAERVTEVLREKGEELLDAGSLAELLELLIVTLEVCDREVVQKLRSLGDRAGNALRLVGILRDREPKTTSTSSKPTSSTDSPSPTGGEKSGPSTASASPASPSSAPV